MPEFSALLMFSNRDQEVGRCQEFPYCSDSVADFSGELVFGPDAQVFKFIIDLIDDNGEIIAGHGRVEAAKLLGLTAVPALIAAERTGEKQGKQFSEQGSLTPWQKR